MIDRRRWARLARAHRQLGGQIFNPITPTYLGVNSQAATVDIQANMASGATLGNGVGSVAGGFQLNAVAGGALGNRFFNQPSSAIIGSSNYVEVTDAAAGSFGWASIGTFQPLSVGDHNGPGNNTPNVGGFTIDIYAGIGQFYNTASNPGYFIGITSTLGSITAQFSANAADAVGIILDSTAATLVTNWAWITRRGAAAAVITPFAPAVVATAGQFFAVRIAYPANSDAGFLSVKQLTAPGVWTPLLSNQSLAGIGPAKGTFVGPIIEGKNFVNSGNQNGIIFHRCMGVVDQFSIGSAF